LLTVVDLHRRAAVYPVPSSSILEPRSLQKGCEDVHFEYCLRTASFVKPRAGLVGGAGIGGAGAVLFRDGVEIWSTSRLIGDCADVVSCEWYGLILGLEECVRRNVLVLKIKHTCESLERHLRGLDKARGELSVLLKNARRYLVKLRKEPVWKTMTRREGGNIRAEEEASRAVEEEVRRRGRSKVFLDPSMDSLKGHYALY